MSSKQKRVLVVDANIDTAESLADLIRFNGHQCETLQDGSALLDAISGQDYEMVIIDTKIRGMSMAKLLKQLNENAPQTKTALITSTNSYSTQGIVTAAHPDYYLVKPFSSKDVAQMLSIIGE